MDARITISGNVGSDIVYRLFEGSYGETAFVSFRLAMTPRVRGALGWEDGETTWISVNCTKALAENVNKSVSKGHPVIVEGKVRTQRWVDKITGEAKERTIIEANAIGHNLQFGTTAFAKTAKNGEAVISADAIDVIEATSATSDDYVSPIQTPDAAGDEDPFAEAFNTE